MTHSSVTLMAKGLKTKHKVLTVSRMKAKWHEKITARRLQTVIISPRTPPYHAIALSRGRGQLIAWFFLEGVEGGGNEIANTCSAQETSLSYGMFSLWNFVQREIGF